MDPESSTLDVVVANGQPVSDLSDDSGYSLILAAAILGGIAMILSLVYGYIYCTKIRPRNRALTDDRINYYERDPCVQYGGRGEGEQAERAPIKAHPFFLISYLSRMKTNPREGTPSTSAAKRY